MVAKGSVGIGQGSLLAIEPIPERPPVDYGEDPQVSASKFIRDMSDKFNLSTSYKRLMPLQLLAQTISDQAYMFHEISMTLKCKMLSSG